MRVIQASIEHLEPLATLFETYRKFFNGTPNLDATRTFLERLMVNNEATTFIAVQGEDDGTIFGFVNLYPSYSTLSLQRIFILNDLYIDEIIRGKNVATKLIDHALLFAKESGAIRVELKTDMDNTKAQRFYERIGFQVDAEYIYYRVPL